MWNILLRKDFGSFLGYSTKEDIGKYLKELS